MSLSYQKTTVKTTVDVPAGGLSHARYPGRAINPVCVLRHIRIAIYPITDARETHEYCDYPLSLSFGPNQFSFAASRASRPGSPRTPLGRRRSRSTPRTLRLCLRLQSCLGIMSIIGESNARNAPFIRIAVQYSPKTLRLRRVKENWHHFVFVRSHIRPQVAESECPA